MHTREIHAFAHAHTWYINPRTPLDSRRRQQQTKELGKNACGPDGAGPALTKEQTDMFKDKISKKYRINMVLDNLPVTVYDLQNDVRPYIFWVKGMLGVSLCGGCWSMQALLLPHAEPLIWHRCPSHPALPAATQNEFVRPGFELGYEDGGKFYVYNHLRFNVLVHPTHGEYMRARQISKVGGSSARRLLSATGGDVLAVAGSEGAAELAASSRQLLQEDGELAMAGRGCGCEGGQGNCREGH